MEPRTNDERFSFPVIVTYMENDLHITKPKSLGPSIHQGSTGQGITFLRFLRVCVFSALLKKEFSQKQTKKARARIVSNKRRNCQCNAKLENQISPNAKLVAWENSRRLATLPLVSPPSDVCETNPDLGSAFDWLNQTSHAARPISSTTQISVLYFSFVCASVSTRFNCYHVIF